MKDLALLLVMFFIGTDVWSCEFADNWTDECEAQFQESIKKECKRITCLPEDEGR